jgi:DNA invertase Pin-like site-specific DNA recombinase
MAVVGYGRVSTTDQSLALQEDALRAAGCVDLFLDTASGALVDRPQLDAAMAYLRPGDVLCVWRLDRLGRSLKHLIGLVGELEERGVGFRSITESIDTTTAAGRLLFHIMGSLAEFERALVRERTIAGLTAARARGRRGGRKTVMTTAKQSAARELLSAGSSPTEIASVLGVSRATLYRFFAKTDQQVSP